MEKKVSLSGEFLAFPTTNFNSDGNSALNKSSVFSIRAKERILTQFVRQEEVSYEDEEGYDDKPSHSEDSAYKSLPDDEDYDKHIDDEDNYIVDDTVEEEAQRIRSLLNESLARTMSSEIRARVCKQMAYKVKVVALLEVEDSK
ncbi:hypothetical protein ACLB2K_045574 [Fragaria x ananassa]